jgi:hypothetical protein
MRLHRHQVDTTNRWHSVRAHHDDAWDWCAHHEEIEHHLSLHRHAPAHVSAGEQPKLQAAH